MAVKAKVSMWQALAAKRWPGYKCSGDGNWACVDASIHEVFLLTHRQNAHGLYRAAPHCRAVFELQVEQRPTVWERDDYQGPS